MKTIHSMKTILCGLTLLVTGSLHATLVTYDYYGTIDSFKNQSEPNFDGAQLGDTVHGVLSYDTTTPGAGGGSISSYALISMSLQVGNLTWSLPSPYLEIDLLNDYWWEAGGQGKNPGFALDIELGDTMAPFIQNDTLLRPPPDVSTVDVHRGTLTFFHSPEPNIAYLNFNIDRVVERTSNVPDSGSTLGLFAASIGLLTWWKRRTA